MNVNDIANGLIFQKMHIDNSTFEKRVICQKKIYLLQSLGTNLGYSFNWYIHGPYSPDLTAYIYENLEELRNVDLSDYSLCEGSLRDENIVEGLGDACPDNLSEKEWYELLASLEYISDNRSSWSILDKESLFRSLRAHKPQFTEMDCNTAYDILHNEGFPGVRALT